MVIGRRCPHWEQGSPGRPRSSRCPRAYPAVHIPVNLHAKVGLGSQRLDDVAAQPTVLFLARAGVVLDDHVH